MIPCLACKRLVGYDPKTSPTNCAYCGEAFPRKAVVEIEAPPQAEPPKKDYTYRLNEMDCRLLKQLHIAQDVPDDPSGPTS